MEKEIKTTGQLREFTTGAHRDNATGKGRMDLVPLGLASEFLGNDLFLEAMYLFQRTFKRANIIIAIKRAVENLPQYFDGMSSAILAASQQYEAGAEKYGAGNWTKGMPIYVFMDSAIRHYLKCIRGDEDEPHEKALMWNLFCLVWTLDNIPNALEDFEEHTVKTWSKF